MEKCNQLLKTIISGCIEHFDFWRFSAVSLIFILKCIEKHKNRNLLLRRRLVFNYQPFLAETTHSWKMKVLMMKVFISSQDEKYISYAEREPGS